MSSALRLPAVSKVKRSEVAPCDVVSCNSARAANHFRMYHSDVGGKRGGVAKQTGHPKNS